MLNPMKGDGAMKFGRTDLAVETVGELTEAEGVWQDHRTESDIPVTAVELRTPQAAKRLGRPVGRYVTVDLGPVKRREDAAFRRSAQVLAGELEKLLPKEGTVLVVGLGNRQMTPDRLGPLCCDHLLVTRHLLEQLPEQFQGFRAVAALTPGVLGSTGVESALVAGAVTGAVAPSCVVAVDALAARGLDRLCATVQLSDAGIAPGSGVGNHRQGLTRDALGVPVLAFGVPTVAETGEGFFVTPKDIDAQVAECAKLMAAALNLALQPGLTLEDLAALTE